MKKFIASAALLGLMSLAHASEYTGTVLTFRTNPSQTTAGYVRVSVQVAGATSCSSSGWYSYELPDGATSNLFGQVLTNAIVHGRQVHIGGKGTCDPYAIEQLYYIDLK